MPASFDRARVACPLAHVGESDGSRWRRTPDRAAARQRGQLAAEADRL